MALTVEWESVVNRFHQLERYDYYRPIVASMLRLIDVLRHEPAIAGVKPSVSLGSLNLSVENSRRHVMVAFNEANPPGFKVSFVDSAADLEYRYSATIETDETTVVDTILQYLDQL